jgi:hypothetical protein
MNLQKLLSIFPKTAQQVRPDPAPIATEMLSDLRRAGFREDQPRWPKGSGDDSGRWSGGAGTTPAREGPRTRGGHHYVPRELFDKVPLQEETRRVFENETTGKLPPGVHVNDKDHREYTKAVFEAWRRFLAKLGLRSEQVTPDQGRAFVDEIKQSSDPRIRWYNFRLWYKQFRFNLRRPRSGE